MEIERLQTLKQLRDQLEAIEAERKEIKKLEMELCEILVKESSEEMLTECLFDGRKYSFEYKNQYSIKGGSKSTPERTKVISLLIESGFIDPDDVETYQEIHDKKLQSAMARVGETRPELLQQMQQDGLISVWSKPEVLIKASKK